jgi:hypothetical protein
MDGPEVHTPHAGHTGHRWLDITLGVSALMVSAISLYVAVHHGQTMEKLVEANSFPNVEMDLDVGDGKRPEDLVLRVSADNNGVGPARVETLELWEGATPLVSVRDVLAAIKARGDGRRLDAQLAGSTVIGGLLGAGKSKSVLELRMDRKTWFTAAATFAAAAQDRVCYCSVFDECFMSDSRLHKGRPYAVKVCPVPAQPYDDDISGVLAEAAAKVDATAPQKP